MSDSPFEDIWASLVSFCQSQIAELKLAGVSADLQYYDFDSFSGVTVIPNKDLIGLQGFSLDIEKQLVVVEVIFNVSTRDDDTYLTRHRKLLGHMLRVSLPGTQIPHVDALTGAPLGTLVIGANVSLFPIQRVLNRSSQGVGVELRSTVALKA